MTAKIYRLPDGSEIASLDVNGTSRPDKAWVTHPTLGTILIDRDKLTEVPPPLPQEPPAGSVVLDKDGDAWQREDSDKDEPWAAAVFQASVGMFRTSWAELNGKFGPLTRLVPDPSDDAPPLPWTSPSYNSDFPDLKVDRSSFDGGVLEINGIGLAQNRIRELMGICARMLKPGAERDALQNAAYERAREARRIQDNTQEG